MKLYKKALLLLSLGLLLNSVPSLAVQKTPESDRLKTIRSLKKIDDFPLYIMRFYGDYELPNYATKVSLSVGIQCTCFSTQSESGSQLLGRNFDWEDHPALLLFTDPPTRYASISMVDISYFGYSKNDDPGKSPGGLMQTPLLPFDGMNEQGLAVGMMAVPSASAPNDPQKQTVGSLLIIRLILDNAKNVEEAIRIFKNFNIDFQGGPPLHYIITDRSKKSVVIEFVDQKLSILPSTQPWQVATNFNITGYSQKSAQAYCGRYQSVWETLEDRTAPFAPLDALSLLKDVSQRNTIWSVVYDTSSLDFLIVMGKKYDQVHRFMLQKFPGQVSDFQE